MKKIAIVGSGGLGREVLGIIQSINKKIKTWEFLGFFDDNPSSNIVHGFPVLGKIDALNNRSDELAIVIAIGNPKIKEIIFNKINNPVINFPNIMHPSVIIYSEKTTSLGKGIVIGANCVLTVDINLKDFVYVNTGVIISHDTSVGKFSMLMPSVSISTGVNIGEKVYLGNGTIIDKPISINDNSIIKAGSVLPK